MLGKLFGVEYVQGLLPSDSRTQATKAGALAYKLLIYSAAASQ